jgi:phosphoglycolate phosphatase
VSYESILFDLDGTLTDPKEGITNSVKYALGKFGIEEQDMSLLVKFIGPPLAESFESFYSLSPEDARKAIVFYREYYSAKGIFENEAYEGIADTLAILRGRGRRLFVATSKPTVFAERVLEHFDLRRYFSAVAGSELDGSRTDKAEVIGWLLSAHALDAGRTVMVGDRRHDIAGARKNGIASIAVGYGYGDAEELEASGASFICQTVEGLLELLL